MECKYWLRALACSTLLLFVLTARCLARLLSRLFNAFSEVTTYDEVVFIFINIQGVLERRLILLNQEYCADPSRRNRGCNFIDICGAAPILLNVKNDYTIRL